MSVLNWQELNHLSLEKLPINTDLCLRDDKNIKTVSCQLMFIPLQTMHRETFRALAVTAKKGLVISSMRAAVSVSVKLSSQ